MVSYLARSDSYASTRPDLQAEALCSQPVRSFVGPFICYQTRDHNVLKTIERIVMQIGASGPRERRERHETINVGCRRSKVKVTRGQGQIWRTGEALFSTPLYL